MKTSLELCSALEVYRSADSTDPSVVSLQSPGTTGGPYVVKLLQKFLDIIGLALDLMHTMIQ